MNKAGSAISVLLVAAGLVACRSKAEEARRRAHLEEARLYSAAATRSGDKAARSGDMLEVVRLRHLLEARDALLSRQARSEGIFADAGKMPKAALDYERKSYAEDQKHLAKTAARRGGTAGDAFDGATCRCDNLTVNFWHSVNGNSERHATVIQRRDTSQSGQAGLSAGVACVSTNKAYWIWDNVYIR